MFGFFKELMKNENSEQNGKKYFSCKYLNNGIAFMPKTISFCSHKSCLVFLENYKGEPIDWKEIAKVRKQIIENCKKGIIPENCKGCVDLEVKNWEEHKLIDDIYINHWDHCNCGCVYCVAGQSEFLQTESKPSRYYDVLKHLKDLYKHKMISKNVHVELVGGDLTVLDEADDIINLCLDNGVGRMSFHSSCIYYSKGIERALKEAREVDFYISLDCGDRELYKKIKRVDAMDQVVENLKRYIKCSEKAKNSIIASYIIVDGLNDSVEELDKWLYLLQALEIKKAKIDVNFRRFFPEFHHPNPTVPQVYYDMYNHYHDRIKEWEIEDCCWEFSKRVFENGGLPKDY